MAHPTTHRRVLALPDPKPSPDPPVKNHSAAASRPTPAKLDPIVVSTSSHLSNPAPISRLRSHCVLTSQRPKISHQPHAIKDSHLQQAKALTVSAIVDSSKFHVVKSKPQPKKIVSGCNEESRKSGKVLDGKKDGTEGAGGESLYPVVKHKGLKAIQEGHRFDNLRPIVSLSLKGGRRRSFGGSEVELADIFANNGVKVVSVDMPPFMQIHAVDCARKTHDSMEKFTSKTLALSLKREFDGAYGPAWHCIVGTSFGSFVTHSVGGFLYFSMDQKLYVLLFKTTVQRAD